MTPIAHLWLYFLLVFGVILTPGMDMAYVLASALIGGRKSGFAAIAGIVTAAALHMASAVLGISVLLRLYPPAFKMMLLAGAAYIAWIGLGIVRRASVLRIGTPGGAAARPPLTAYRQGMLTNLLNPNAYLFTLAVIPYFLRPDYGLLWLQGTALWGIGSLCEVGIYGAVTLLAAKLRARLERDPTAGMRIARAVGTMLMLVAVFAAVSGWRNG
ncbi:MAG TPA: LysE family translocator [Gammaproteobacteria bacterium]|jgi:threonine/homoserine/homoserine lactone efflux protein|nr:LysE family translocator [Gammaproteobacteria bacterium]